MSKIYSTSPVAGVDLQASAGSAILFEPGTKVFASDGFVWMYVVAGSALGSADSLTVTAGNESAAATADSYPSADGAASAGVANFVARNGAGAIASGEFFWARSKHFAPLA